MSEIAVKVKELIVKQLAVAPDQVTDDARFVEDLNADSLDIVELIMALEEEFSSDIPDDEAEGLKTVGDAIKYIETKTAAAAEKPAEAAAEVAAPAEEKAPEAAEDKAAAAKE